MSAASDPRRLEELLVHSDWLRRFARGLAADTHAIEDGLQDTWCAALAHPPRPDVDPRPWLGRVLQNLLRERRRGEQARAQREERTARSEALPSSDEVVEGIELGALVLELLRAQPEPYRRTLYLRYVEGLSAAAIARREGIPAGTVRARMKRGLDAMRAAFDERLGDRRSWCALLLARFDAPALPGAATRGLSLLRSVVAMNAMTKALGVAAVLVLGIGVWQLERARSVEPAAPEVSAVETVPASSPDIQSAPAPAPASEREPSTARDVAIEAGARTDPTSERAFAPATLELRFVDQAGLGIPDVLLRTCEQHRGFVPIEAESDRQGAVQVEVEMLAPAATIYLYTTHPERARRFLELHLDAGGTTPLGDVLLLPTATLAGVVRDDQGRGIAGATIWACPPETLHADAERSPRIGPLTTDSESFRGETDADGRFRIEGVAIGERRVWAGAQGFYWSSTEVFALERDQERAGIELLLERLPEKLTLRGIVRAPDGEPVPYAQLQAWCAPPEGRWRDQFHTDASGRFGTLVDFALPHELRAVDREGRWTPAYAIDAAPGGPELVLQFSEPRWLEVHALSAEGLAIADFSGTLRFQGEERPHFIEMPRRCQEGVLRLLVPERDFRLELQAPGYLPGELGPFLGGSAPAEVVATLRSTPGLRGVVTTGSEPLAGAQVELGRLDAGQRISLEGFACRFTFVPGGTATTGADGSFVLNVDAPGRYVLVAHHPEHASAELGPLELDPRTGARDLRIGLGEGGSIEGAVSLADGADATGRIVAASRGDGHVRTTRVDRGGHYRLEKLCPGPWQLALRGSEGGPGGSSGVAAFGSVPDAEPIRWSCEVSEGRITRHDLSEQDE